MNFKLIVDKIRKAYDIEEKAVNSYVHALRVLKLQGMDMKDLEEVIKKVAIDTLIHKELMNGVLKAYEEALKKDKEVMKDIEGLRPSVSEKALMVKLLKDHLIIEAEMIEFYRNLAAGLQYPVLKDLAEALAKNEEEHHRLISDLIKKYEHQ
ncbi:MAG: ferritin family protein [Sulfolobales archaeon]|nr:ferritin family protein [Sulfolobales archaeon]